MRKFLTDARMHVLGLSLLLVVGCATAPGQQAEGGEGDGDWSYAKGPHGENCLFYKYRTYSANGDWNEGIAMSCDDAMP